MLGARELVREVFREYPYSDVSRIINNPRDSKGKRFSYLLFALDKLEILKHDVTLLYYTCALRILIYSTVL